MAKKKKTDDSNLGLGEFDDWFADGESDEFWNDDKANAVSDAAVAEAAAEAAARAAEAEAAAARAAEAEAAAARAAEAEAAAAKAAEAEAAAKAQAEAAAKAQAEAAAKAQAEASRQRLAEDRARAAAAAPHPTIIADMEHGFPGDPETEQTRPPEDDETENASRDEAGTAAAMAFVDDDFDEAATAEDFLDDLSDFNMVLRHEPRTREPRTKEPRTREPQTKEPQTRDAKDSAASSDVDANPDAASVRIGFLDETEPKSVLPPPMVPMPAPGMASGRVGPTRPATQAADRWAAAAASLEGEASVRASMKHTDSAESTDSGPTAALWAAAGSIHFERLGNWERAESLFGQAWRAGFCEPEFLKAYADVAANQGNFEQLRDLLSARAQATTGVLAAEALQDAALVERNNLHHPEDAATLLESALEKDPADWFALRLLREIQYRAGNWVGLMDVLGRMAALVTGPRAARVQVERGRTLEERMSDIEGARAAYDAALDAAPEHTPAFLAVERTARAAGDFARLAALYAAEAQRTGGANAEYWRARSLRMARLDVAAESEDIAVRFQGLMAAGGVITPELRREHQVFLSTTECWSDLAAALQEEADASEGMQRAWVLFRLGRIQEKELNQPEPAVASYRAAAEADPSAGPAVEAAAHLLATAGRHRELVELLQDTLTRLDDPNLIVTTLYRIGELCEGPLDDQDGARTAFERILDTAPGYLPALEGLERVYTRLNAWDTLAAVYEQRAILAEEPQAIALQLHRAGSVCEFRLSDGDRARAFYSRALENVPDFPPSLDATVRIMEGAGDWVGLGRVLRAASEATKDSNEIVSLTYRAARILADRVGDNAQAMALLRRCLQLSPGFLPAIQLLRDLATQGESWQDVYDLHRLEADAAEDLDRRHWRMLVAAEAAERTADVDAAAVVTEILEEDAGNIGALRLLEEHALASGDTHDQLAVYQRMAFGAEDDETRTRLAVRIAELAADAGDAVTAMNAVSEVIAAEGDDRPLGALARLAERANYWEEAQRAIIAQGEGPAQAELARIQEAWIEDATAAGRTWATLLERNPADVEAAAGLERALARAGSRDGLAHAHGVLADHLPDPAVAAVHALLAGHLYEADDDIDNAVIYYDKAFAARPVPGKAFDALRRVLGQRRDADGLVELFGRLSTAAPLELAVALEEAGDPTKAVALYRGLLSGEDLSDAQRLILLVRLEQDLVELEEWKGLFETLGVRLTLTLDDDERTAMESQRRWILAEHLAETDEAWDFYRQLHEDDPQDVEVLEALARIAGARGETGLAIQYLEGLAESTTDPSTAARYQRRIAEAHLVGDAPDLAREALMRALDYEPGDLESLHLLKELATQAKDWPAVVGALARESTILQGDAQIVCYQEIAATWQDQIGNADVAADAWRKVLEVAPDDPTALRRLVDLSRTAEGWTQLVEYGSALVPSLEGADRAAMLTELGRTQLEKLHNEEEAVRLLDAASRNLDGNLEAAQILERIHASRGQWDRVAEAVARQATASAEEDRVPLLARAAEILSDTLHDRPGAADVYASILEIDPKNVEALRFRGDYLFTEGQLEEAVVAYQALDGWEKDLDLDDFDDQMEAALYQFRFGEALRRLGRKEEALGRYQQALAFNTAHMPSLEAVGPIFIEKEDWDAAAGVYRKLLQLIGGQGHSERLCRTYTNLGTIERHQGKLDKARKRFTKALDIKANDIKALQGMAAVLFARKDWNNLLNVYNNIIYHAQEPTDVIDAYVTKGFVLDAKMNLPDKAAQHYEKSLAFNPAQPASLLRLSELALRRQDWPEAGSLADRGLALDQLPSGLEAGLLLAKAVAHTACGDNAAGKAACQGAIEVDITLPDELGEDPPITKMAEVLKARLQAAP